MVETLHFGHARIGAVGRATAEAFAAQTDLQAVFANPSVPPAAKQGASIREAKNAMSSSRISALA